MQVAMINISDQKTKEGFIFTHKLHESLSPALLAELHLVKFSSGEYILTQRSHFTHLFFLVQGKLQTEHYEVNGERIVFSFETAFSVIGDMEIFSKRQHDIFSTVVALSDAYLLTLPIEAIKNNSMREPKFLTLICQQLSDKLINSSLLHSSASFTAEYKLRRFLSFKIKREGELLQLENRESLAAVLGISARQLNRALAKLSEFGMIQVKNKSLRVLDYKRLIDINVSDSF